MLKIITGVPATFSGERFRQPMDAHILYINKSIFSTIINAPVEAWVNQETSVWPYVHIYVILY